MGLINHFSELINEKRFGTYAGWLCVVESAGSTRPVLVRLGYGLLREAGPGRSVPTPSPGVRPPGDPVRSPPPAPPCPVVPAEVAPLAGLRRRGWYLYSGWSVLCCWRRRSASCTKGFLPSSFNNLTPTKHAQSIRPEEKLFVLPVAVG